MRGIPPAIPRNHVYRTLSVSLGLLLGACSSVPVTSPMTTSATARGTTPANPAVHRGPSMPAAGSGRGGYYQDDGPGDNPPANLLAIPDAEPKLEPIYPGASKPYVVFGKTYTPIGLDAPLTQRGTGSWYGKKFHGQKTSSGERYDMYKMTAAHPTMPLPSYARVTNLSNGKQVIVRVNDRGPFHSSRIIDLSYTAALRLGYLGKGSTELQVERLLPAEIARMERDRLGERAMALNEPVTAPSSSASLRSRSMRADGVAPVMTAVALPASSAISAASVPAIMATRAAVFTDSGAATASLTATPDATPNVTATATTTSVSAQSTEHAAPEQASLPESGSKLVLTDSAPAPSPAPASISTVSALPSTPSPSPASAAATGAYYLQLGAFSQASNAEVVRSRLQQEGGDHAAPLEVVQSGTVYRLFSGPFSSRSDAALAAQKLQDVGQVKAFVVQR